jgi:hypothetical protein
MGKTPCLDAGATFSKESGDLALFVLNPDLSNAREIDVVWEDQSPGKVANAMVLTGNDLKAMASTTRSVWRRQILRSRQTGESVSTFNTSPPRHLQSPTVGQNEAAVRSSATHPNTLVTLRNPSRQSLDDEAHALEVELLLCSGVLKSRDEELIARCDFRRVLEAVWHPRLRRCLGC